MKINNPSKMPTLYTKTPLKVARINNETRVCDDLVIAAELRTDLNYEKLFA
jgi:hypothetical protein